MVQKNTNSKDCCTAMIHCVVVCIFILLSTQQVNANGCTGSWFQIEYSYQCGCWKVCSNVISDCDVIFDVDWDFGDGGTGTGNEPCYTYTTPGSYTVTMTVRGLCHLRIMTCDITNPVVVEPYHIANAPLTADFIAESVCYGEPTTFLNTSTTADSYVWNFGDGTTSTLENPPAHLYDSCGAYIVTLTVTQSDCCSPQPITHTIQKTVYVDCPPNHIGSNALGLSTGYIYESTGQISADSVCRGTPTSLTFTGSPADSLSVLWEFNNDTSTKFNPQNIYFNCSEDEYNYADIIITNTHGCADTLLSFPVLVYCWIDSVSFSTSDLSCFGDNSGSIITTPYGGTPPFTYQWNPPNQNSSILTGLPGGIYSLTVTDVNQCTHELDSLSILEPEFFTGVVTTENIECYGWNTGTAVLTVSGGTFPNQYIWSSGSTHHTDSNLYAGAYYLTATDANGCIHLDTAVITQNPELMASVTSTSADCGVCDGTATVVNPSGGSGGPYSYLWDANAGGQTTQTAVGLCGGIYNVLVMDDNVPFCGKSYSIGVPNTGAQPVTATNTDVSCFSGCDGTATVTLAGGCTDPPCIIQWFEASFGVSIGQDTTVAVGLCAGDYFARVVNALGCESFAYVIINSPNELTANVTSSGISCPSLCDGFVSVAVSGGTMPYTFQWLDGSGTPIPFQFSPNLFNVCPGTYSLVVRDFRSCRDTFTATVTDYTLSANTIVSNLNCYGICAGGIAATPVGIAPPYEFQWLDVANNPLPNDTNPTISGLCAGIYAVSITDNNGCDFVSPPVAITQPVALNVTMSTVNNSCYGICDGSASVVASGGTAPYRYQWSDAQGINIAGATSNSMSSLCPGTYRVLVTDDLGCRIGPTSIAITQTDSLILSAVVTHLDCGGGGQGMIDLTVSGGVLPYGYSWNNGFSTLEDITGLSAGNYNVVVTDNNGCSAGRSWNVIGPAPLTLSLAIITYDGGYHQSCSYTDDGAIIATVGGGTPPFNYSWNDPDSIQTTSIAGGLDLGTYTVTVTDDIGCTITESATLFLDAPPFFLTSSTQDVTCGDDSSGSIQVVAQGGEPPYFYYWAGGGMLPQSPDLNNIPAGQYSVTVLDTNNCVVRDTFDITLPNAFSASVVGTDVSCFGFSDGTADLTVSGGIGPFAYSWNNGAYLTEDLTGIPQGIYTVIVTDLFDSCTASASVNITEPTPLSLTSQFTNPTCNGASDGTITLTVTGGTQPFYSFDWNNGFASTKDLNGVTAGQYAVEVQDTNGCILLDNFIIVEPPVDSFSRMANICRGDSLIAGGALQGSSGTYYDTYASSLGCDSIVETILSVTDSIIFNRLIPLCEGDSVFVGGDYQTGQGTYYDKFLASGGCDSVVVTDLNLLPVNHPGDTIEICEGRATLMAQPGFQSYEWNPGGQTTQSIEVGEGTYELSVTSSNGCRASAYFMVMEVGKLGTYAVPDSVVIETGSSVEIQILHSGIVDNPGYSWSPPEGLDCINCPLVNAQPPVDQTYTVIAVDDKNCPDTVQVKIFLETKPYIFVPNAFSPNGDGQNDVFRVFVSGYVSYRLLIFDRWGEKMFESYDPNEGWDGVFRGVLQNPDVFVYYVDVRFVNGLEPPEYIKYKKGSVTLIR